MTWKARGAASALVAGVLLLVSACGGADPAVLANRSFASTMIEDGGKPKELWKGTTLQISFIEGELSATGGCNSLFGKADFADGVIAVTGELGASAMACPPAIMAQDDWFAAFLKSGPNWALDGDTLTLTTPDAVVTMEAVSGG